jgi:signal transduction histidine kinase
MHTPAEMESDVQFLMNEVKQLRKQRADLLRRLSEFEQCEGTPGDEFPLSELSRMTDGIVHDMRSGLGVIRNTIGFLTDELTDSAHQADLLKISRSLDFCELVLRNLSALGGQDIFQPKRVNLEAIAREMYFMLERKLVDVNLVLDTAPDTPQVLADEGQMKQVLMNLIKNAGEAMPNGGTLTFRTRPEGAMLRVEVSDTGCGILPENEKRLFREFFTTRERGYGLGLYIVHTIVTRHGGTIEANSKVGEGTTFILHLPIEVGVEDGPSAYSDR